MDNYRLYELLNIPDQVIVQLSEYGDTRDRTLSNDIYSKLLHRNEWDQGVKELQELLVNDTDGIQILWEQLNIVSNYTYDEYIRRGISLDIFAATMKFCARFLREHHAQCGVYKYVWAWWFPRQMSLSEFRIGALEYEFVDGQEREIAVHIPSDADMSKASIQKSLKDFSIFRDTFFSEWQGVRLTCNTWMLMPELQGFLNRDSNIIAFQNLFEIVSIDRDATWYMGWIYPGYEKIDEHLPENTLLQRELKKYLLVGNKFGIAKGYII